MTALKENCLLSRTDVVCVLLVFIVFKKYHTVKKYTEASLKKGAFFVYQQSE